MGFIFWMSSGDFSEENTSRFIVPLLHLLSPGLSADHTDLIHKILRKSAHVFEYFVLGILLFHDFRGSSSQPWRLRWSIHAVILVVLYAVSDEFHQSFIASRTASLADVGIDSAGGILSQIAIMCTRKG